MRGLRARLFKWFARRVGRVPHDRLERMLAAGWRRRAFLRVVFRAMPKMVRRKALERENVVIEWRIAGRPDGRHDIRRLRVADGRATIIVVATVSAAVGEDEPDLCLTVPAADLLLVATGHASAPALFAKGRLEIEGDPWLAARLQRFFALGRPGS